MGIQLVDKPTVVEPRVIARWSWVHAGGSRHGTILYLDVEGLSNRAKCSHRQASSRLLLLVVVVLLLLLLKLFVVMISKDR